MRGEKNYINHNVNYLLKDKSRVL